MKIIKALWPPVAFAVIGALLTFYCHVAFIVLFVVGAADVAGRYRDYKYLSSFKYIGARQAVYYGKSFCGRAVVSAIDPYFRDTHFYARSGYRWWHILPDGFPMIFFNPRFYQTLVYGHRKAA